MQFSFPLVLLVPSCLAGVVPLEINRNGSHLISRQEQGFTNPDKEPQFQDPVTGNMIDKSRVLSGIGPEAALLRYFDWDESCQNLEDREKIEIAWNDFQLLVTGSSDRLGDLHARLPVQPVKTTGKANPENEKFIKAEDPAYTQMFKARDTGIAWVQGSFDLITRNLKNFPGRGNAQRPPALRFICNADNHVKKGDGVTPYCGFGDGAADALALVPQPPSSDEIEWKYRFSTATSITFCPRFFDDSQLPNMRSVWNNDKIKPNLNDVDCRERVMLHEYMHVPWVRNMNPVQDARGYFEAAKTAATLAWGSTKSTPDCYAWYALYSAYNNQHQGCERDIWPAGVEKWTKD